MPGTPIPFVKPQWFKDDGTPAAGYQLFVYDPGTTTKQNTWSDEDLSSLNTNPIILDSAGRASIYLSAQTHKFVLATDTDTDPPAAPLWTMDDVSSVPYFTVSTNITRVGTQTEWSTSGQTMTLTAPHAPVVVSNYYVNTATTSASIDIPAETLWAGGVGVGGLIIEWETDYASATLSARCTMFGSNEDLGTGAASTLTRARYVVLPTAVDTVSVSQTVWQNSGGGAAQVAMAHTTIGSLDLDGTDYTVATGMASGTYTIRGSRVFFVKAAGDLLG